jgi:predicted PurR-regulated permease PerM
MAQPDRHDSTVIPSASHTSSQTRALWILATLAMLASVRLASGLLIPIVIAVLLSLALEPLVARLVSRKVPRSVATALVLGVLLGALAWGAYSLKDNLVSGVRALPEAAERARELMEQMLDSAGMNPDGSAKGGQSEAKQAQPTRGPQPPPTPPSAGEVPAQVLNGAASAAQRAGQSLAALLGNVMVVVFLMFFLLYAGPDTSDRIVALSRDEEKRRVVATILADVNTQIQRFLLVRLVTSAIVAAATWAVLAWMGAQNAVVWGVLAGVFNSIPYFGPVIVSGGLFVVGLVQGGTTDAIKMAAAALAITSLEGWLLTPPLMGRAERMNVLSVFLGLLLWTWLWGAWGTLLAVPMLAVVKSVADRVESLRPLGRLMGS